MSWAVADGREQEREPMLWVHVFTGRWCLLNPFFHPSQYLLTRCLHRATFLPQSETKCLDVVCSQQPSMDAKWVDGAKPLFKIRIHLDSTIYTQVSQTPWNLPAQVQRKKLLCLYYSSAIDGVGKRALVPGLQSSTEILLKQHGWDYLQGSAPWLDGIIVWWNESRERLMFPWPVAL